MVETEAAVLFGAVRRQQACFARQRVQFAPQRLLRTMRTLTRIVLVGDDLVGDEAADAITQRRQLGGKLEIDHNA